MEGPVALHVFSIFPFSSSLAAQMKRVGPEYVSLQLGEGRKVRNILLFSMIGLRGSFLPSETCSIAIMHKTKMMNFISLD